MRLSPSLPSQCFRRYACGAFPSPNLWSRLHPTVRLFSNLPSGLLSAPSIYHISPIQSELLSTSHDFVLIFTRSQTWGEQINTTEPILILRPSAMRQQRPCRPCFVHQQEVPGVPGATRYPVLRQMVVRYLVDEGLVKTISLSTRVKYGYPHYPEMLCLPNATTPVETSGISAEKIFSG